MSLTTCCVTTHLAVMSSHVLLHRGGGGGKPIVNGMARNSEAFQLIGDHHAVLESLFPTYLVNMF